MERKERDHLPLLEESLTLAAAKRARKRCLVIYTGGTIGMLPENGVLKPGSKRELKTILESMVELQHPDIPEWTLLEWDDPIDSSNMTPQLWIRLAKQIEDNYYDYDGFIVLHGTDTMAYTASAMSFMLENLAKTIVFTGSMIPLYAPVSDAKRHLIISLLTAANFDIPEVCIFFNNALFRSVGATKWFLCAHSFLGYFTEPTARERSILLLPMHLHRRICCHWPIWVSQCSLDTI